MNRENKFQNSGENIDFRRYEKYIVYADRLNSLLHQMAYGDRETCYSDMKKFYATLMQLWDMFYHRASKENRTKLDKQKKKIDLMFGKCTITRKQQHQKILSITPGLKDELHMFYRDLHWEIQKVTTSII